MFENNKVINESRSLVDEIIFNKERENMTLGEYFQHPKLKDIRVKELREKNAQIAIDFKRLIIDLLLVDKHSPAAKALTDELYSSMHKPDTEIH